MTATRNQTTTTVTLVDADTATTTRVTWIDGPTDATVTVDLLDRVDHTSRGTGRSWITADAADDYGLTDAFTRDQLALLRAHGRWITQPHSRGHRLLIVANQDAARANARDEAVAVIGRAVLDGAVVALRDTVTWTPEALASLDA